MSPVRSIGACVAHSRWGRAALHFLCLARGRNRRWHSRGILRELRCWPPAPSAHADAPRGKRSPPTFCALLLCALSGGGLRVFAFPGAPALELLPAAQVDRSGIYLQQMISPSSFLFPDRLIRLANAPAFGQATSVSRAQISELLQ